MRELSETDARLRHEHARAERATASATDDEREALARIVVTERIKARGLGDLMEPRPDEIEEFGGPTADAILAAGFRRQGPITDEMVDAGAWAILDRNMDTADRAPSKDTYDDAASDARAALEAAERAR